MKKVLALAVAVLMGGAIAGARAQVVPALENIKSDEQLTQAIKTLDTEMFHAYNACDLEKLGSFLDENVEFYRDGSGLMVGRKAVVDGVKNNICGKATRELVPGSLEVHPIGNYGAVEIGVHRFLPSSTQDHGVIGEAKFIQLWQYKDGAWRITRVISYDHRLAK